MKDTRIVVLGIGNILLSDEGFGIRVVERLQDRYEFSENVSLVDGGVLGMSLLGILLEADHLIVVDAIRNRGTPGTIYRLESFDIPSRIRAKNSLHQIDFLETLTLCGLLDKDPATVLLGSEPEDMKTLGTELTSLLRSKVNVVAEMVLEEIGRLGGSYRPRILFPAAIPHSNDQ